MRLPLPVGGTGVAPGGAPGGAPAAFPPRFCSNEFKVGVFALCGNAALVAGLDPETGGDPAEEELFGGLDVPFGGAGAGAESDDKLDMVF